MGDDMEKAGLKMDHDRLVYHSLKEGGQSTVGSGDCVVFLFLSSLYIFKTGLYGLI